MEREVLLVVMASEIVLAGVLTLLSPRIARRGLLFGVYVGEETWGSERAAGLVRRYTVAIVAWMALMLAAGFAIGWSVPVPFVTIASPLLAVAGFGTIYLWAHLRSRPLDSQVHRPSAGAVIWPVPPSASILPFFMLPVGLGCYGQGGSRLERAAASAPLTNGLADNRHWVLGTFHVNREDPALLIEHRFGLGYTVNLGNWKAVALLLAFSGLVVGLTVVALVTH